MRRLNFYGFLVVALTLMVSCADKKNQKSEEISPMPTEKQMMEDGYSKARVVYDEEAAAPCNYLLLTGEQVMEPLEFPKDFKKADLKVWIKYVPQRRQGRCGDVLPIELTEIKKRTEN